jgi:hypothetical protein
MPSVKEAAKMPVGKANGEFLGIGYLLRKAVDVDIVVAKAFHFGEFQLHLSLPVNLVLQLQYTF